jgi:hypothetical protein
LIFIAFKNPLLSACFEPTNLGSNGKHANHYTPVILINTLTNEDNVQLVRTGDFCNIPVR